jgi:hypothetical protein
MMAWRMLAILPLIFLGAAAEPSGDCASPAETGQTMPAPADLGARPSATTGLGGQAFAALPTGTESGCSMTLPSITQSTTLRSESNEVLHGLPTPDIQRRMDEPRRAPEFE